MFNLFEQEIWETVERISKNTNCKDRAVGCVIYNTKLGEVVGRGWNSHIDGQCDCDTHKTAIHAENMALQSMNKHYKRKHLILFVNHAPCKNCKSLIETRVDEVRYKSQK